MASLNTLPAELLTRIAGLLCVCVNCAGPPETCRSNCFPVSCHCFCRPKPGRPDVRQSSYTLSSLSLASRRLRRVFIEWLYHRPNTTKWWLLARTALERPDLAALVRELYIPENYGYPSTMADIPDSVVAYYRERTTAHAASVPKQEVDDNSDLSSSLKPDPEVPECLIEGNTTNDLAHSILASLFPALETMEIVTDYRTPGFSNTDYFHFNAPGSLPCLHTIHLVWYSEVGGTDLTALKYLFRAAPNLRSLGIHAVADVGENLEEFGVTMTHLTDVDIRFSAMSKRALEFLLKTCPAIETFRYESGGAVVGEEQFNPTAMMRVMLRHGPKLKRVVVDFPWADECKGWRNVSDREMGDIRDSFARRGIVFGDWGTVGNS